MQLAKRSAKRAVAYSTSVPCDKDASPASALELPIFSSLFDQDTRICPRLANRVDHQHSKTMANIEHVTIQATPAMPSLDERAWRLPPGTESRITTLAAICHARQKQRDPLDCDTGAETEGSSEDDSISDTDESSSNRAANLTDDSDVRPTKTVFLDRLAEILCSSKDASFVTCASMITCPERVTVFVARNARWTDNDVELMECVAKTMEKIASRGRCTSFYTHLRISSSCRRIA
jgi:hypothetical protein